MQNYNFTFQYNLHTHANNEPGNQPDKTQQKLAKKKHTIKYV